MNPALALRAADFGVTFPTVDLLDDIGRARVVNGNEIKPTLLRHSLRTAMKNFSSRQDRR